MVEENKSQKYGIYVFAFVLVVAVLSMYFSKESAYIEPDYIYMEEGWEVSGSLEYHDANLTDLVFNQVKRGQEIVFENVMPEYSYRAPALGLYTIHSAIRITVGNEVIYNYGFDRIDHPNRLIGYGYHVVPLPEDCQGKPITIYLKVAETNAFTNFEAPWIGTGTEFVKNLCIQRKVPLFIITFLIVMGVLIFILSLRFGLKNKDFNKLACIGAFSITIGLWSLCNYDLIFLFSYNPLVKTYAEFISLYLTCIPLILYFWDDIHHKERNWSTEWYYILLGCQLIFSVVALILQAFEIVSLPRLLLLQHLLIAVLAFYLITTCILEFLSKTYTHIALAFGIMVLFVVGIVDMVRFNIQKYIVEFQGKHYTSLICVGTLIFIICQLIDYALGLQADLIQLAQTQTLQKLAYIDELTELYNRRKCEQELDDIEEKKEPFGIFSFDLNNLKTVNDNMGHEKGDEMIRAFAAVLKKAFANEQDVLLARTGGDEFLAIYRKPEEGVKKAHIDRINELLREENEKREYSISVAIGYAYLSDYTTEDVKSTLRKADKRMYKYKAQMKSTNASVK